MSEIPPLIGIDVVEPRRLEDRLNRTSGLAEQLFTPDELAYCRAQSSPAQHLAARFCAKEAVIKALGIDGWDPLDVEIVGGGAKTSVRLHGDAAAVAGSLAVRVSISMTHVGTLAAAVALAQPMRPDSE